MVVEYIRYQIEKMRHCELTPIETMP